VIITFPHCLFFLRLKPGSIPTLEGIFYMFKPHFPTRLVFSTRLFRFGLVDGLCRCFWAGVALGTSGLNTLPIERSLRLELYVCVYIYICTYTSIYLCGSLHMYAIYIYCIYKYILCIYIYSVYIYIMYVYIYIYTRHVFTWLGYACIIVCIYIYVCMNVHV
jgi:hypothetical protein